LFVPDCRAREERAFYIAVIKLVVALTIRLVTGAWPRFGHDRLLFIVVTILFSTPFQAGEEIGWRGYPLPRLTERLGLSKDSVPSATPGAHQMWSLHASPVVWLTVAMLWICASYFLVQMQRFQVL
jgi:hypothetical protein